MSAPNEQADDNDRRIGRLVAEARDRTGLSQADVAKRVGLTRSSVANIEAGRQRVHAARLAMLARVLCVDAGDLLSGVELPPLPPVPHKVTVEPTYSVTCETCGELLGTWADRGKALAARRDHIALELQKATP